jgi:hypothetical protein
VPSFQRLNYSLEFPFFEEEESDNHIDILGRDDVIKKINSIIYDRLDKDKYWPVIISSSRGTGKTFLLKKFGMQKIKDSLKTDIIGRAITSGRILSFDFAKNPNAIQNIDDIFNFFPRLMIFFLCRIFDGTQVDGINFQEIRFFKHVERFIGKQVKFNEWLVKWRLSDGDNMMREYIRLTNLAFGIEDNTAPVFLLDEIQKLSVPTNIEASMLWDETYQMHSQLSLLLIQLAGRLKPVCICAGTDCGNIKRIAQQSPILPQVLSLTPLVNEYEEFWKQLTAYSNQRSSQYPEIQIDADKDLIDALAFASYQIPRLLFVAHSVWFDIRKQGTTTNRECFIQAFDEEAVNYYAELPRIFKEFTTESIAHIILACGVRWIVYDEESNVPGTEIPWATLIHKSLIFPYFDRCYIFPFSLVWRVADTSHEKEEVETRCAELVPNLNVNNLYISYDILWSWENYNLEVGYENLFASSLAVKYYLLSKRVKKDGYVIFPYIYDISRSDLPLLNIMSKYKVNLSHGISMLTRDVFTNVPDLEFAILLNRNIDNGHHDIILPARRQLENVNIAVQAKLSFDSSDRTTLNKQLLVSPTSLEQVQQLFRLYLPREEMFDSIVFLDGRGCCNWLALDMVKKLRSKIQK